MSRVYQVLLVAAMGRVSGELKENGYQLPAILETQLCTSGLLCNGRVIFGRVTCLVLVVFSRRVGGSFCHPIQAIEAQHPVMSPH